MYDFEKSNVNLQFQLESDFNHIYPEKTDIIYSEWPKVAEAIIQEVTERKINITNESDYGMLVILNIL